MSEGTNESHSVSLPRVIPVAIRLALVPVLLLLGLAGYGEVSWPVALASCGVLLVASGAVAHLWLSDLDRATALLQQLRDSGVAEPAVARLPSTAPLFTGIHHVGRAWREESEAVRERLSASETALERLPDPLLVIDADRRVVRANAAARRLLGDSVLGRDLGAALRTPAVLSAVDAGLRRQVETDTEFEMPVPVARQYVARIRPLPRPMADGGILVLSLYDVTTMKRSEQMRADFVANASHELRTPLAALIGYIETLRGPAADDTEAHGRFLQIMHEQSQRMSRLVDDLLSLSRIELNEHSPPTEPIVVGIIARKAAEVLELRARQRDMSVVVDVALDVPQVAGDEYELMQVFQNLIDNAIKYGARGTRVRIRVGRVQPDDVAANPRLRQWATFVSVEDQGDGIPREHIPRLTERFYRVDPARSRALGGTGLGLAIVKHILNRHRGALIIDSEVGRGSVFTAYFPPVKLPSAEKPAPRVDAAE
ncbi:MAG: ATP-binding protein [Acetobacterales bacterium]